MNEHFAVRHDWRPYSALAVWPAHWGRSPPYADDDGKPGQRGGTVIAALTPTTIPSLNTHLTSVTPLFAADVWADGLMSYDREGKRIPRLATEWDSLRGRQDLHLPAPREREVVRRPAVHGRRRGCSR
jgi:hypothetical protein